LEEIMTILDWIGSVGVLVTILATIIGGVWWLQKKFLLLENKINEVNSSLENRINEVNYRINEVNSSLGSRINEVNSSLGSRINESNSSLGSRMNEINYRINEVNSSLGNRISNCSYSIKVIVEVIKDMLKVNETIMTALIRSKLILPEEQATLYKSYGSSHTNVLDKVINSGIEKSNPFITKEEGKRLWKYRDMCLAGARFTMEEAEDFHRIVHKLEDVPEVHQDGGYGVLLSLAALVMGATLCAEDEAKRKEKGGDE
jgi:tetrahydromethanopterin S-methyltransferase subunit G